MEVDVNKKTKNVQHTPRYRLKPEWSKEDVIEYLIQCGIVENEAWSLIHKLFGKMVFSVNDILEFTELDEKIQEGGAKFSSEERGLYELMLSHLSGSPFTALVRRAACFPHLFWTLQAILPKKAYGILAHNLMLPGTRKRDSSKGDNKRTSRGPDFQGLNEALEENPWEFAFSRVLYKKYNLSGCEAKLTDLEKSGVFDRLDDVKKDSIIVYDKLKNYCWRYGHTYMKCPGKKKFSNLAQHHCKDRSQTQMFLCSDRIRAAKCEPRSVHSFMPRLFLWKYWKAEKDIALYLRKILAHGCDGSENDTETGLYLPPLENDEWEELDENQRMAVNYIRTKPLTVLSGMGGCGKTTVVSKLVTSYCEFDRVEGSMKPKEAFSEAGDHCILLTAPTGKAASLLGKKCGLPACTIHSVIYSHMAWKTSRYDQEDSQKMSTSHEKKGWKFAGTKMLVVDECSMVAVTTFERLLKILLDETSLCKLVLIGDIRQLPSIEPGNFFEDIFQVASQYSLGVDLKTNHRVDAGGKSIVKNAKRISLKKMPKFDEETFALPEKSDSRFSFLEIFLEDGKSSEDALRSKARDATMERLDDLLDHDWRGIRDHTTSQIITFTRSVVANANQSCCKHYNDHYTHDNNKREFKVGDKICCRKNCKIANPFYKPKVGDASTGAGFSGGNHQNRKKNDDVLSAEDALSNILGGNQEKTGREDNDVLSSDREKENQVGTSPWQQGDKREDAEGADQAQVAEDITMPTEGQSRNIRLDGIEMGQVPEELVPMELTDENEIHRNERYFENADLDAEKSRALERDGISTSDAGVGDHTSLMCEDRMSEGTKANEGQANEGEENGVQKSVAQSAKVGERDGKEEDEQYYRICNGDTFIIKEMMDVWDDSRSKWKPAALLDDMESDQMWVDFSSFRRTGKAEHAWCRTIHTFQGSEVKTVVYLISSCKSESWKHVYTAVTRGKEEVVVIGPRKYLREALSTDYIRDTGLKGFFQKELDNWQRSKAMSAIEGSTAICNSLPENSNTEMEETISLEGTPGSVEANWDMLSSPEVSDRAETYLSEGNDVYAGEEDSANGRDNLPFVSYQGVSVAKESSQNNKKQDFPSSLESQQPSFLTGPRFTELRDNQPKQDLSVGELPDILLPTGTYPPNSEGFHIAEMVTSPSKLEVALNNQKEPSFSNSPLPAVIPSQKLHQGGIILREKPEQEDGNFGTLPSPHTMAVAGTNQPSQNLMGSSRQSVSCAAEFKKYTQEDSQYSLEEQRDHSPDYTLKCSTPEKNKNELEPETVTSPSKSKFSFKNRRESGILNSPSPPRMQSKEPLPERKRLPQSPEQEVRFVGTPSTPSKEVAQTVMYPPRVSPTCATQFKKRSPKSSQHPLGEDSPYCPPKYLTPEKDETDLGRESEEFESLSLMSPMDTGQEFRDWNRSGARKRLHNFPAFLQTPTKSPKK
ncbi:DNA helicase B [Holothuria leucospilota]|uniref:DNA helicase B n=1 Tax=Holothuria leucospilota TaxID=206669 RepID=A0A9Q1BHC8_HOLLE|nr:DNA helicase B [Holothuria leucospilota]